MCYSSVLFFLSCFFFLVRPCCFPSFLVILACYLFNLIVLFIIELLIVLFSPFFCPPSYSSCPSTVPVLLLPLSSFSLCPSTQIFLLTLSYSISPSPIVLVLPTHLVLRPCSWVLFPPPKKKLFSSLLYCGGETYTVRYRIFSTCVVRNLNRMCVLCNVLIL